MKYLHLIWHSYDGQLFTSNPIVTPANPRKKAVFASCVFARNSYLFFTKRTSTYVLNINGVKLFRRYFDYWIPCLPRLECPNALLIFSFWNSFVLIGECRVVLRASTKSLVVYSCDCLLFSDGLWRLVDSPLFKTCMNFSWWVTFFL